MNTAPNENGRTIFSRISNLLRSTVIKRVLPILLIAASLLVVLYYIIFPSQGYFHSDCTDTLFWAQATYDSGQLVSDNFKYAAILPFGGNLIMLPLISLFGVSMTTHIIGMVIFALLFVAALIFMFRSMKYNGSLTAISIFCILFILSSSDKLREIMWGHIIYYSLGILFFCVGLGIIFRILDDGISETRRCAFLIIFALFTILASTNGLQAMITLTVPIIGAVFAERLLDSDDLISQKGQKALLIIAISGMSAIIGLALLSIISGGVTAGYADAYSSYSAIGDWAENAKLFFYRYFTLIGVTVSNGEKLASVESIKYMIRIIGGIMILILPVTLLIRYNKIKRRNTKILLWAHLFVSAFIIFAFICGKLSNANWRLTPLLGTSVVASTATLAEFISDKGIIRRVGILLIVVLIIFASLSLFEITSMPSDYGQDNDLHMLSDFLKENRLEYGYATFWNAQAITVISDSAVKVRNVSITGGELLKYEYQSQYSWFDDQEGVETYFLLLTESESRALSEYLEFSDYSRVLNYSKYKIYLFDKNLFTENY